MHFSLCVLFVVFLLNRVFAFYPYRLDAQSSVDDRVESATLKSLERRLSLPLQSHQDQDGPSTSSFRTLEIRRAPVRRVSNYTAMIADTPSSPNSVALDQDGRDFAYFAVVKLGSDSQEMWMMLDTGGTNTWVYGMNCESEACILHRSFNQSASRSFRNTSVPFTVEYDTGKVSGTLINDSLSIADLNVPMVFGVAAEASNDLVSFPNDGIIGLSRSNYTGFGTQTFMGEVTASGMLKSNIVAFRLSRASNGGKVGEVTFGGVDKSKFIGDITYTDVVSSDFKWTIPVDDAAVDKKPCNFSNVTAVIDTGTSYTFVPPGDAKAIHDLIPGASSTGPRFALPCNTTATLRFTFSGVSYTIPPGDYVKPVSDGKCISAIVGLQVFKDNEWLVGDVFLKNVYSVFDFDNNRIGFARAADLVTNLTTFTTMTSEAGALPEATYIAETSTAAPTVAATDSTVRPDVADATSVPSPSNTPADPSFPDGTGSAYPALHTQLSRGNFGIDITAYTLLLASILGILVPSIIWLL